MIQKKHVKKENTILSMLKNVRVEFGLLLIIDFIFSFDLIYLKSLIWSINLFKDLFYIQVFT